MKDEVCCLALNNVKMVVILCQFCSRITFVLRCVGYSCVAARLLFDKAEKLCRLVSAVTQRVAGGIIGLLEAVLLKFYQYVVDPAEPGTWPIRFFTWAATGPIK